jgi:hypothetical protein
MSTVVYTNVVALVGGANLSGDCNQASVDYVAEMLDATTFGDTTRRRKGGLTSIKVGLAGFVDHGIGQPLPLLTDQMGAVSIFTLFPDGVTLGAQSGVACQGAHADVKLGGAVGTLYPFTASIEGAGTGD